MLRRRVERSNGIRMKARGPSGLWSQHRVAEFRMRQVSGSRIGLLTLGGNPNPKFQPQLWFAFCGRFDVLGAREASDLCRHGQNVFGICILRQPMPSLAPDSRLA